MQNDKNCQLMIEKQVRAAYFYEDTTRTLATAKYFRRTGRLVREGSAK
jgi:hypothetical protein